MDPFTLLIQRTESERKFEDILPALRELQVANPERREHFDGIIGRLQENTEPDIPAAQIEINNFALQIPEFSINDIAARPNYRPMTYNTHWKEENGRVFYNEALLTAAYEDENVVAARAREEAANRPNPPNAEELERTYQRALNQQATINATACRVPPVWTLIQRKDLNDTRAEDSWLQYSDDKHKHVNWYDTLRTIQTMGAYLGYTELHYRRLLDRFISYFASNIAPVARRMPLVNLCRMLMTSSMPAPEKEITLDAIRKLTRSPGECLRTPMTQLYNYANAYYETDGTRNYEGQVNQLLFIGLQHFTMGQTKAQLIKIIKHSQTSRQRIDYQKTLNTCIESEKLYGAPTETLQYGQNLDVVTVFNSVYDPVESLIDTDIIPVQPSLDTSQRRTDKKYGSDKKEKSGPTIHSVKAKILGPRPVHGHYQSSTQSSSGPSSAPSTESSRRSTPEPESSSQTSRETTPERTPKTPREERYKRREERRQSIDSQSSQSSRGSRRRKSMSPAKTNKDTPKTTAATGPKKRPKKEKQEPVRRSVRTAHNYNTETRSSSEHATPTNSRNNSRSRSQDRNQSSSYNRKDRESSAEAKRLAQEGARKAQSSSDKRYQSNDRNTSYENRSRSPGHNRQDQERSSDRRQQDDRRSRTPTNNSYRPYSPRNDGYQSSRNRYQSPRRDDRYQSPRRDHRYQSPRRDSRYQSPRRDSRYQSPRRDSRYQSPRRDTYRSSDRDNRSSQYRTNSSDNHSRQSNYYSMRDNQNSQYRSSSSDRRQQYQNNSSRQQSPYRSRSPYQLQSYGNRPASPYRQSNSQNYSRDSRQRSPYRSDDRQRSRSPGTRPIHGLNCSPNYKDGEKFCRKCMTDGHPEPQCQKYYIWTPSKCSVCRGGYHMSKDCLDQTPKNY